MMATLHPARPPVFDPHTLAALFGDAPDVIRAVLETFANSMADHLQQLQAARAASDAAQLLVLAHRIKGAASMSGAFSLAQAAEQLEHVARSASAAAGTHSIDTVTAAMAVHRQWELLHDDTAFRAARHVGRGS